MADWKEYDISTEEWREYIYASDDDSEGIVFRIEAPVKLYIRSDEDGDTHRIVTKDGVTVRPERGWIAISWYAPTENVSF